MLLSDLKIPVRGFDPRIKRMTVNFAVDGQKEPILIKGNIVVDGIIRCLAALKLGWEEIEVRKL